MINPAQEIGENVIITERRQLLSITQEQSKKIKSLRIENQEIDDDFADFFMSNVVNSNPYIFTGVELMAVDCFMLIARIY